MITCVHVIQLKLLTAVRVGQKQKKININIPKLDEFIHRTYVNVARKIYKNMYLFELGIPPLQIQKNNRELEIIVQESILNTVRESIPVDNILRAYLDETIEEEVIEEIKEEVVHDPVLVDENSKENTNSEIISETKNPSTLESNVEVPLPSSSQSTSPSSVENVDESFPDLTKETSLLTFNDVDFVKGTDNKEDTVSAPKTIERLEEISEIRNAERKKMDEEDEDDDGPLDKIKFSDQSVSLNDLEIIDFNNKDMNLNTESLIQDIEILS